MAYQLNGVGMGTSATITGTVGTPLTFTFNYFQPIGIHNAAADDLEFFPASMVGFVFGELLPGGVEVFPGVQVPAGDGIFLPDITNTCYATFNGTPTQTGTFVFKMAGRYSDDLGGPNSAPVATITVTINGPGVTITPSVTSPDTVTLNAQTNVQFSAGPSGATGGGAYPNTWTITSGSLPTGMGLTTSPSTVSASASTLQTPGATVYIAGTPTGATGSYPVNLQVTTLGGQQSTLSYTFIVSGTGGSGTLTVTNTGSLPSSVNQAAPITSTTFSASGGNGSYTYSISAGVLPPGVTLNGASGLLSGTPTTVGVYSGIIVTATDTSTPTPKVGSSASFTITVNAHIVLTPSLPAGTEGIAYSGTVLATGGMLGAGSDGNYYWSVVSGLPSGVTANVATHTNTLTLSGTPNIGTAGTANVIVSCQTINTFPGTPITTTTQTVSFTINPGTSGLSIITDNGVDNTLIPTKLQYGGSQPTVFTCVGATGTVTWSAVPAVGFPAFGTGMSFNPTYSTGHASLSGNPSNYASCSIIVTAHDSGTSLTASHTFSYSVVPQAVITGTLPSGTAGSAYSYSLVGSGGDNTGFTWITSGFGSSNISASPDPTYPDGSHLKFVSGPGGPAGGTYHINVQLIAPTGATSVTFSSLFNIVITGTGVTITPFADQICSPVSSTVIIGANLQGGVAGPNHNLFTISGLAGTLSPAGPYVSGQTTIRYNPPGISGSFETATFTSVEDGSQTTTTQVSVATPGVTGSSLSPAGPLTIAVGAAPTHIIPSIPNSCNFPTQPYYIKGIWTLSPNNSSSGSIGPQNYLDGSVNYTPPLTVPSNPTVTLAFTPVDNALATSFVTINLVPSTCALTISTGATLPTGTQGTAYQGGTFVFATTGGVGTISWAVASGSNLPPGLLLNSSTGALTGTPTGSGSYTFSISASDAGVSGCTTTKQFTLPITPSGGVGSLLSIAPQTGNPGTSVVITGTNILSTDTITVVGTVSPGFIGGSHLALPLTIVGTPTSTTINGTMPSGFQAGELVELHLIRSTNDISALTGANGFTYSGSTPRVTSVSPSSVNAGASDTFITVGGNGFDGSPTILWDGGSIGNPTVVAVAGTSLTTTIPSSKLVTAGSHSITVRNSDGSTGTGVTFSVNAVSPTITTTQATFSATACTRGSAYTFTFAGTGGTGAYTWSVPAGTFTSAGLTLAPSTGVLSGATVSNTAPAITFTLTLTDAALASTQKTFTLQPVGGTLAITCANSNARNGVAYSSAVAVAGGNPPYTFTLTGGALPKINATDHMTIDGSTGIISGTPNDTAPASYNYTVQVQDAVGVGQQTVSTSCVINLLPAISVVTITPSGLTPNSGPIAGGTPVAITGSGFQPNCVVKFGSALATNVSVTSSSNLTCVTPPGSAGPVTVSITNADSGTGSLANAYTYTLITAPVILSVDKPDGPFAGGRTVVLSGNDFQGTTQVTFGGITATIVGVSSAVSPNTITCITPASNAPDQTVKLDVDINATNAQGTGTLPLGYTYRPAPIITAIIPNQGPTTGGQTFYVLGKNFFSRGTNIPRVIVGGVEVDPTKITLVEN